MASLDRWTVYPVRTMSPPSSESSSRSSFGRTVVAALVVLVVGWLLLGVIGHILSFLFSTVLLVLAIVAVIWALRVLL
jgi:hypothetical protein